MMRICLAALAALLAAPGTIQITARSRSVQPGELVVLSIAGPPASGTIRVRAFDRAVSAYADADGVWRALVGIDLDVKPGTYRVAVETGAAGASSAHASYDLVVKPRVFRTWFL